MLLIHPSARKHGLTDDKLRTLWQSWVDPVWLVDDLPGRLLRACIDEPGRPWELVAVVFDDDRVLIIHAMRLRKSTAELFRRSK